MWQSGDPLQKSKTIRYTKVAMLLTGEELQNTVEISFADRKPHLASPCLRRGTGTPLPNPVKSPIEMCTNLSLLRRGAAGGEADRRKRSLESFSDIVLLDFCLTDSQKRRDFEQVFSSLLRNKD